MIGLAAVATAAMAFGASGASASTSIALCGSDGLTCASPVTHLHEVATNPVLLNDVTDITCLTGLFLGDVLSANQLASLWLVISGTFTYSHCLTAGGATCDVLEVSGGVTIEVMKLTGTEKSEVIGEGEVLVDCSTTPHCVYKGENLVGHGLGPLAAGGNGSVSNSGSKVEKVSGFFCPKESFLDSTYVPLSATYLSS